MTLTPENLRLLLESYGIKNLRESNGNIYGCCPFHSEQNRSWGISVTPPFVYGCFACKAKGNLANLVAHVQQTDYATAAAALEKLGVDFTRPYSEPNVLSNKFKQQPLSKKPSGGFAYSDEYFQLAGSFTTRHPKLLKFARHRGFSRDFLRECRIEFDESLSRVVFPWYVFGELVGFTGRVFPDDPSQVKTLPYCNFKKGQFVYFPKPPVRNEPLVIVEGETSALAVAQAGLSAAALGFGSFTENQKNLVLNIFPSEVIVMTDNDSAGHDLSVKIVKNLKRDLKVSVVDWNQHAPFTDPADLKSSQILALAKNPKSFLSLAKV
jgi:DNA primase